MPLTTMRKRILRSMLYRLGPFGVAALLFALANAPSALAFAERDPESRFRDREVGTILGRERLVSRRIRGHHPVQRALRVVLCGDRLPVPAFQPSVPRSANTCTCRPATPYFNRLSGSGSVRSAGRRPTVFKSASRTGSSREFWKVVLDECTTSTAWVQRTVNINEFAGRYVELSFTVYAWGSGSATYVLLDDISL